MMRSQVQITMESKDQMTTGRMNGSEIGNGMLKGEMPTFNMNSTPSQAEMPVGAANPDFLKSGDNERIEVTEPESDLRSVLVELRVPKTQSIGEASQMVVGMSVPGFQLDTDYEPVPIVTAPDIAELDATEEETIIVRGTVEASRIQELEAQPNVVKVYPDTPIAPFSTALLEKEETAVVMPMQGGSCPIGACDCDPRTAKGAIADVAKYLGVNQIWNAGYKGEGIVVAVVDGGITAEGRPVRSGETARRISRVIGGWPTSDWGTQAAAWGEHGNMCSTDVLGMAPQAKIYDIRISNGNSISNALAGFQWAINQHKTDGTPQIITNSWGIFQEAWDRDYARNPNHPFTRKVVEAINEGILVLFAAGNCGGTCPDQRCGSDSGPGRSTWGANGHPLVMTVGAVNKNEQFVGYSSQGPAALDPQKPDFCSITHFQGYFGSDSGTSAATPIAAGVVALLKQAKPTLTQDEAKQALKNTAKDIGDVGFDQHSGAGIIQAKAAYDSLVSQWSDWLSLGGYCMSAPAAVSSANRAHTFVLGGDSAVYHKYWDGSAWSGWQSLGGFCLSAPAAVSWGENRIDVFAIGGDRALYQKSWNGSAWSGWVSLGGYLKHGVAVSSRGVNRLDCFAIGADNAVWHKSWDGAAWSDWGSLGGFCLLAPAAVSSGQNRIDVFAVGSDRALYQKSWNGTAWSDWLSLGGYCLYSPAVVSTNRLNAFAIGADAALYQKSWDGSAWSDWLSLGGFCTYGPGVVATGANRIDAFAIGGDNAMYHKWFG